MPPMDLISMMARPDMANMTLNPQPSQDEVIDKLLAGQPVQPQEPPMKMAPMPQAESSQQGPPPVMPPLPPPDRKTIMKQKLLDSLAGLKQSADQPRDLAVPSPFSPTNESAQYWKQYLTPPPTHQAHENAASLSRDVDSRNKEQSDEESRRREAVTHLSNAIQQMDPEDLKQITSNERKPVPSLWDMPGNFDDPMSGHGGWAANHAKAESARAQLAERVRHDQATESENEQKRQDKVDQFGQTFAERQKTHEDRLGHWNALEDHWKNGDDRTKASVAAMAQDRKDRIALERDRVKTDMQAALARQDHQGYIDARQRDMDLAAEQDKADQFNLGILKETENLKQKAATATGATYTAPTAAETVAAVKGMRPEPRQRTPLPAGPAGQQRDKFGYTQQDYMNMLNRKK